MLRLSGSIYNHIRIISVFKASKTVWAIRWDTSLEINMDCETHSSVWHHVVPECKHHFS